MGHVRLGRLPQTRTWQRVVGLLGVAAPANLIASASAAAAERAIGRAASDPALTHTIWLLTQLPLAARTPDFPAALRVLGLQIDTTPTFLGVIGAFTDAVDREAVRVGGRTDLGELAQQAAAESLTAVAGQVLPSLFSPTPEEVRRALARLTSRDVCWAGSRVLCEADPPLPRLLPQPRAVEPRRSGSVAADDRRSCRLQKRHRPALS